MRTALRALLGLALCATAVAQDPAKAFPQNYRVLLDNPDVYVLRAHYGPHEAVGVHEHSDHPTVYVYLNDSGAVRFVHEPENVALVRPPTQAGAFRVSPGRMERHSVLNLSGQPADYVRVELKRIAVGTLKPEFRAPAPPSPLIPGTTLAYSNALVKIERVVCAPTRPCVLAQSSAPSVLVAFTPVQVREGRRTHFLTSTFPAEWLPSGVSVIAGSSGPQPVHLLRIYLLTH